MAGGGHEGGLAHRRERVAAIKAAVVARLVGKHDADHPQVVRRRLFVRGQGRERASPLSHRHHVEDAASAQPALAGQKRFCGQLDLDGERAPPHPDHPSRQVDDLADPRRGDEVDALAGRGDEVGAGVARGGDERHLVHVRQTDAAEQRSVMVGIAGKDDVHEPGGAVRHWAASRKVARRRFAASTMLTRAGRTSAQPLVFSPQSGLIQI